MFLLQIKYPNNLLRNTAKHGVASNYTLIVDIDMKPNKDLYRDFMTFAVKNNLFDGGNSFYNGKGTDWHTTDKPLGKCVHYVFYSMFLFFAHLGKHCCGNIMFPINVSLFANIGFYAMFLFVHLRKGCCGNILIPINVSLFFQLGKHCCGNIMFPVYQYFYLFTSENVVAETSFPINVSLFVHLKKHCCRNIIFPINVSVFGHLAQLNLIHQSVVPLIHIHFSTIDRSVFVLPAFEMSPTKASEMPKDKTRLIEQLDDGTVRPFYYSICFKCQKPTDYEKWRRLVFGKTVLKYNNTSHTKIKIDDSQMR